MIIKIFKMIGLTTFLVFIVTLILTFASYGKIKARVVSKNKSAKKKDKKGAGAIEFATLTTCIGFAICMAARWRLILFAIDCIKKWSGKKDGKSQSIEVSIPESIQNYLKAFRDLFKNIKKKQKRDDGGHEARSKLINNLSNEKLEQSMQLPGLDGKMMLAIILFIISFKWLGLMFSSKGKHMFGWTTFGKIGLLDYILRIPHIMLFMLMVFLAFKKKHILIPVVLLFDMILGAGIFIVKYRII